MKLSKYLFILAFLFSAEDQVLTINGEPYSLQKFYLSYPKQQWLQADSLQKDKMMNDFINRKLCVLEAIGLGLLNDPDVAVKVRDRSLQLLVNETYEHLVAKPLIAEEDIADVNKFAVKDVLVHHILIGFDGSGLRNAPARSKDEALLRAQSARSQYESGDEFSELAKKYSDDPSALSNGGDLGWLNWGKTVPEFQSAAFSLKIGELSDPILTSFGYHLIYIEKERSSELSLLSGEAYENAIFNMSKATVRHLLRAAAADYDSTKMIDGGVEFNSAALQAMVREIDRLKKVRSISGPGSVDAVTFLEELENIEVICVYNGKGFGPRWFANKLSRVPPSRHPSFESIESIESVFKIILLQDMAVMDGLAASVDDSFSYSQSVDGMLASLLYDVYLKHLVNSAVRPDSIAIMDYYENYKYEKYMDPEKVTVREIKIKKRGLADSLLALQLNSEKFSVLASQLSLTNPAEGGLLDPFSKNRYQSLAVAFNMAVGEISGVIRNPDNSFSIILLEEKFPPVPLEFKRVSARIESHLMKENQNSAKTAGIDGLHDKYNIVINNNFYLQGK